MIARTYEHTRRSLRSLNNNTNDDDDDNNNNNNNSNSATLGLLLLPTARNSVWPAVFGVPWEAGIAAHRWLGRLFLLLLLAHAGSWYAFYGTEDWLPHDIWAIHLENTIWPSDFSVPLISVVSAVALVAMGLLSVNYVRRRHFEVFYFAHHAFLALFLAVLWHAPSAWYYVMPGLLLWAIDHAVRFANACRAVKVTTFGFENGVITLKYLMERRQRWWWRGTAYREEETLDSPSSSTSSCDCCGAPHFTPLQHLPGQYVFLNFPDVSLLEWHPFTISSAPGDEATAHHIRKMLPPSGDLSLLPGATAATLPSGATANATFTGRLQELALQHSRQQGALPLPLPLRVNVDGPYGGPGLDFHRFGAVLFIGGGIGITPLHSCFRSLLLSAQEPERGGEGAAAAAEGSLLEDVRLVWTARSPTMLEIFDDTWAAAAEAEAAAAAEGAAPLGDSENGAVSGGRAGVGAGAGAATPSFSVSLYADEADKDPVARAGNKRRGDKQNKKQKRRVTPFTEGRPDLRREVSAVAERAAAMGGGIKKPALVFVCHVPAVSRIVGELCQEHDGVYFHTETFEL